LRADDTYNFNDDGIVFNDSSRARYEWMLEYALNNGAKADGTYYTFDIDNWEKTGKRPNITSSYWIGGLESLYVKGHYEIKINHGPPTTATYNITFKNTMLHWTANDQVDTHAPWHPEREKNWRGWIFESAVWLVGDKVLGANYNMWIHCFQSDKIEKTAYGVEQSQ
jgi:hypothetical protein